MRFLLLVTLAALSIGCSNSPSKNSTHLNPPDSDLKLIRINAPEYPADMQAQGEIKVAFDIGAIGVPEQARIVSSNLPESFERASLDAIQRFKYAPKRIAGEVIPANGVTFEFWYRLPDSRDLKQSAHRQRHDVIVVVRQI